MQEADDEAGQDSGKDRPHPGQDQSETPSPEKKRYGRRNTDPLYTAATPPTSDSSAGGPTKNEVRDMQAVREGERSCL